MSEIEEISPDDSISQLSQTGSFSLRLSSHFSPIDDNRHPPPGIQVIDKCFVVTKNPEDLTKLEPFFNKVTLFLICNLMRSYPKDGNGHGSASWQVQTYGSISMKSLILPVFQLPNAKDVAQFSNILGLMAIHSLQQHSFVIQTCAWTLNATNSRHPVHLDLIFPNGSNSKTRKTRHTAIRLQKQTSKTLFSNFSSLETSLSTKRIILSFGSWSRWSK